MQAIKIQLMLLQNKFVQNVQLDTKDNTEYIKLGRIKKKN